MRDEEREGERGREGEEEKRSSSQLTRNGYNGEEEGGGKEREWREREKRGGGKTLTFLSTVRIVDGMLNDPESLNRY